MSAKLGGLFLGFQKGVAVVVVSFDDAIVEKADAGLSLQRV